MRNIKLTIEYDGTAYHGWQSQVNAAAVQDIVNAAVNRLTGEDCTLYGSSRTDAGVHAFGQAANFRTESRIPADKFAFALNTLLPGDIVIVMSEEVEPGFHARFSARGKKYRYLFYNSVFPSAIMRNRAWHIYYPLDVEAMCKASGYFTGTHDFLAFSASGGSVKTTVRTITGISVNVQRDIGHQCRGKVFSGTLGNGNQSGLHDRDGSCSTQTCQKPGSFDAQSGCHHDLLHLGQGVCPPGPTDYAGLVSLDIEGDGFLYNMVRIIAGTLVEVGYRKLEPEAVPKILEGLDRKKAGLTAPPQGLYLLEVYY